MSSRPSTISRWCTTGTRVAPSSGELDSGYTTNQIPSSTKANFLFGLLADWVTHFADGVLWELGGAFISSAANAALARLIVAGRTATAAGTERTLVFESPGQSTTKLRLYRVCTDASGAFGENYLDWTWNAKWTGTAWDADDDALSAYSEVKSGELTIYRRKAATVGTWADSAWTIERTDTNSSATKKVDMVDGVLQFSTVSTSSNPSSSTGRHNQACAKNQVKVWASISTDGAGNATVEDGYNITSATISGGDVVVTFADDFANDDYAVSVLNESTGSNTYRLNGKTTGTCTIRAATSTTGTAIDAGTTATRISITIVGQQS